MSSSLRLKYAEEIAHKPSERSFAWRKADDTEPLKIPFDSLRNLLDHAKGLEAIIEALRQSPPGTRVDSQLVQSELSHAADSAYELSDFIGACWEQIPVDRRPSAESAVKAQEVFNTPELLENILINLDTHDVLRAQQVGRVWRVGVNGSIKVLRNIGIHTQQASHFKTPFMPPYDERWPLSALSVSIVDEYFDRWTAHRDGVIPATEKVCVEVSTPTSESLLIVSRWRAISVCQPPLKRAKMSFQLPNRVRCEHYEHEFDISSAEGITVGDVMDAAQQIYESYWMLEGDPVPRHEYYPGDEDTEAEWLSISDYASTHRDYHIRLQGEVTLADDDPEMDRRRWLVRLTERHPDADSDAPYVYSEYSGYSY